MAELYGSGLTMQEVAKAVGVSWRTVRKALSATGTPVRPPGLNSTARYRTTYAPDGSRTTISRLNCQGIGPGLVAHHINGNPSDNRPANLAPLTKQKHALAHKALSELAYALVQADLILWTGDTYSFGSELARLSKRS